MPQFGRIFSLWLGTTDTPEHVLEITGLRITFRIAKDLGTTSNTAVIQVYNLSETTKNLLREVFNTITLQVGYEDGDGIKLIFKGNISESFTNRRGGDLITTIKSGDGLEALITTKFNKGYSSGTSAWDILDDIVKAFGLPEKISNRLKVIARKKGKKFANAFTSSGTARKAMDKIVRQLDVEWSIQNGNIKILELEDVDDSPITLLTSNTGLIGLPVRVYDLKKREKTKKKVEVGSDVKDIQRKGWKLESLLLPEVEPGARIKVQEDISGINGVYRVEKIDQRGDNYGTNWSSFLTVADMT